MVSLQCLGQHKFFSSINGASLCFNNKKLADEDLNFFNGKANCLVC